MINWTIVIYSYVCMYIYQKGKHKDSVQTKILHSYYIKYFVCRNIIELL